MHILCRLTLLPTQRHHSFLAEITATGMPPRKRKAPPKVLATLAEDEDQGTGEEQQALPRDGNGRTKQEAMQYIEDQGG